MTWGTMFKWDWQVLGLLYVWEKHCALIWTFVIYLCFKCTFKLFECACWLMFTPDCVYSVCFHFCESMRPEPSHSVVDKPQTAHSDSSLLFAFFTDFFFLKGTIVFTDTLILFTFFREVLSLIFIFKRCFCQCSFPNLRRCHCLHLFLWSV